jgi:hypothetical protein
VCAVEDAIGNDTGGAAHARWVSAIDRAGQLDEAGEHSTEL